MKRFFLTVLFVCLFVTANSVWATNDNNTSKAPVKIENTEKKAAVVYKEVKVTTCSAAVKESCAAKCAAASACSKTATDSNANKTKINDTKKSSGKK